jgi:tRNA-2-methylthio-N6-dimethylallyladenosine synthase
MSIVKSYHIITIGCQMNKSDSERIAGCLNNLGYKRSDNKYQADLIIINTCGVRQSAEDRVYGIIPRIKKANLRVKIILAGCLSERKDVKRRLREQVNIWLPIKELPKLSKVMPTKKGWRSLKVCEDYLKIKPEYSSKHSAFVPIGNGCNNFCSYCVVPYARGPEVYRPAADIIDEVKKLVKRGYKEIILIAQNVNSYKYNATPFAEATEVKNAANDMRLPSLKLRKLKMLRIANNAKKDGNIGFVQLLRMVDDIDGDFWIRFATSHPKDMSEELIETVAKCKKVCEHIHLPAQSGDNQILKAMNRNYTIEHYKRLISRIRSEFKANKRELNRHEWQPLVAITTDVIVGFPGETREQFNNTLKLFKEVKFDMAYIAQYSPRPGTAAEKLEDNVSREEKKRREEELMKVLRKTALENNKKYVGKKVKVLVDEKNRRGQWSGRTRTNKNVKLEITRPASLGEAGGNLKLEKEALFGKFVKVKIIRARDFGLEGIMVK